MAVGRRRAFAVGMLVAMATGAVLVASSPTSVDAQVRMRNSSESQLLRESAARESRGDYDGAETVLRQLLDRNPASSGGLFALERVLRAKGEVAEILPVVDRFLQQQPESSGVRSLKLRVLAEAGDHDALRSDAEAWLERDPGDVVPYREVARVYERAFGVDEALQLLYDARPHLEQPNALALEIGDLLAAKGETRGAADEWAAAVGPDAAQLVTVTRRIQGLTDGSEEAGRRVVQQLADAPEVGRRRAGARLALDLRFEGEAMDLSRRVAGQLDDRARTTFLTDVARRARDGDMVEVAAWAYDELGGEASTPAERRQFDQRIIDVSLAAGDTATALAAQQRVAESYTRGSVDRRRARAAVIRLQAGSSEPDEMTALLDGFREEFPNAPEVDDLAATVAGVLQARGDAAGAAGVLEGVVGPKSSLQRAYLLLSAGAIQEGRGALLLALTGLPPAEATPVIQFAGLLGRVSEPAAGILARAGVAAHNGNASAGARELADAVDSFDSGERAPLLAEAARIAASGGDERLAAEVRSRLVQEYPDSPEIGEASLALARYHARTPTGVDQAIRLLEDLIAARPNAAVVPDARVELERLRSRGGR